MTRYWDGSRGWLPTARTDRTPLSVVLPPPSECHHDCGDRITRAVQAAEEILNAPHASKGAVRAARTILGVLTGGDRGYSSEHGTLL